MRSKMLYGKLEFREVGPYLGDNNPLMELGKDWVICWIAGNKGLVVADVTIPSYKPEIEKEINGPEDLNQADFWKKFNSLTTRK